MFTKISEFDGFFETTWETFEGYENWNVLRVLWC